MDASALSLAARELRTYLAPNLGVADSQILIGHPSLAAKEAEKEDQRHYLNLFFFRIEHGAYPADGTSRDPFYIRSYLLVTAFADAETAPDQTVISAGENDLRLIGGVMRYLHERPLVPVRDAAGADIAQLQVVLSPLSIDEINHIWSTQGETPYRLSVCYELALMPVPVATMIERSARVGTVGVGAAPLTPSEPRADWLPQIAFVVGGDLRRTLTFSADGVPASVSVVGAGAIGVEVDLVWERWTSDSGWFAIDGGGQTLQLSTERFERERPSGVPQSVALPTTAVGQLQLYAARRWSPDGVVQRKLRSDPLLITIYAAGAP